MRKRGARTTGKTTSGTAARSTSHSGGRADVVLRGRKGRVARAARWWQLTQNGVNADTACCGGCVDRLRALDGPLCPRYRSVDPGLKIVFINRASLHGRCSGLRANRLLLSAPIDRTSFPSGLYIRRPYLARKPAYRNCRGLLSAAVERMALRRARPRHAIVTRPVGRSFDHCLANQSPHVVVATTDGARRDGTATI